MLFLLPSFVFVFLTSSQQVVAQWSSDPAVNTAISIAAGIQEEPQIISDGAGGAIIAWGDLKSANNYDLYAQRVNASGVVQWTANGVAICTAAGEKLRPKIISDGEGGAIIAWSDRRGGYFDIYAQRINKSGIVQWTPDGVVVCAAADDQHLPTLVSDGAGGAIITWLDLRRFVYFVEEVYIYAQHIDASGTAVWTADGAGVCLLPGIRNLPIITGDGAGGAVITWMDARTGEYDIYAQRIDASGDMQWGADGVAVCIAAASQYFPKIVSDGADGAIITWFDFRAGAGSVDIYAQRINASGAMQWTVNGAAVCTEGGNQSDPQIVSDGTGGAIICWYDYRTPSNGDIYAQRVNSSGAMQWTVNGVAVCEAAGDQSIPAMSSDGAGGALVTWADPRGASPDIYAQHLNASGAVKWTADGVAVSTAPGTQDKPTLVSDGAGGAIVTWADSRSGNKDIYAQKVKANGSLGCNSPLITSEPLAEQSVCKNSTARQLTVVATGDDLNYQWYVDNDNTGYNGTMIIGKTGSFTPTTAATGTFYYYVVVSGICGNATPAYSSVTVKTSTVWYQDSDNDSYGNASVTQMACARPGGYVSQAGDCNDEDDDKHPGANEVCGNSIDENCNGTADDKCPSDDTDGDGDPDATDCAPSNPAIHHGATEVCNGKDDDCDGYTDEGVQTTYYRDYDCDGFGNKNNTKKACYPPAGYVKNCFDCNDYDKTIYPGAPELCDYKDNDCDGKIDEYLSKKTYYKDGDCDGYGDKDKCVSACKCPSGYVSNNKDCNDRDKTVYPGAKEVCDNKDNDCDGQVDEGFTKRSYYRDNDKDGYGDPKQSISTCSACPSGYVTNNKDCNDSKKSINPGAAEIAGNKIDDNCNGKVDEKAATLARGFNGQDHNDNHEEPLNVSGMLKVNVLPNPSPNHFTLNMKGGSDKPVQLRVVDIAGRLIEVKGNLSSNNTLTIGDRYRPGIYFVEVMQGSERVVIRCIKQ